jgi:hypothetical protein
VKKTWTPRLWWGISLERSSVFVIFLKYEIHFNNHNSTSSATQDEALHSDCGDAGRPDHCSSGEGSARR